MKPLLHPLRTHPPTFQRPPAHRDHFKQGSGLRLWCFHWQRCLVAFVTWLPVQQSVDGIIQPLLPQRAAQ